MNRKDRRNEIIELQNQLIRARTQKNLLRVDDDLWGVRAPVLPEKTETTPAEPPKTDEKAETPEQEHPGLRWDPPAFKLPKYEQSTDELMRLIRESADSLTRMTEELQQKDQKGTGALPNIPLDNVPVLNEDVAKKDAPAAPDAPAEPDEA